MLDVIDRKMGREAYSASWAVGLTGFDSRPPDCGMWPAKSPPKVLAGRSSLSTKREAAPSTSEDERLSSIPNKCIRSMQTFEAFPHDRGLRYQVAVSHQRPKRRRCIRRLIFIKNRKMRVPDEGV